MADASYNKNGVPHVHIHNESPAVAAELKSLCEKSGNYNPLLHGKKNIGRNIGVELAAGRPRKQAIAIAMNVSRHRKDYR